MLTADELLDRRNFIGGSDCSIICGLNKYKNRVQLWLEKTGQLQIEDISGRPVIEFGNYIEDGVAQWFSDKTGKSLHPKEKIKLTHPQHAWMGASLDRRLVDENAALECKTAGRPGEEWGDAENLIPTAYKLQCAHYCEVGGFDRVYICVVFAMTREFRWYVYERDQGLQDKIVVIERNFWNNNVLANVPPEPSNRDEVLSLYSADELNSTPLIASVETLENVYKLSEIKKSIKSLEQQADDKIDQIAAFLGQNEYLVDSSGAPVVTWKFTKSIDRFDSNLFKTENPELYARYLKKCPPSRRFEIKVK